MAKRVTTLFIRDTSVNLLVTRGERIEKWASLPLEPNLVSQGLIVDEEQVAARVKQIFKETGANPNRVVTALSGHDSLYRILTLPELPDAVLPEAVKREARRTIPTPLEEVYLSYQRLPSPTKGEIRVFLVTFPRNLVDALIRTLRKAGVKAYVMDLAPLCLARIPNEPRSIILNARLDHVDVMVIGERIPQVIRRLVLPTEAEPLEEKLPLIAEEFNRTVAFYNSSHMDNPLDAAVPVFVCGELARQPDTWQSVVGGAGYAVSPLPSPVETPEGFDADEFMVNIGLALKEMRVEKEGANFSIVNLNALPEAYVPPSFSIVRVLIPVVTVIGVGVIALAVFLIFSSRAEIATLRSEVNTAETTVSQLQREVATLKSRASSTETTASDLNALLTSTERGRASIYLDLKEVVSLTKDRVTLTSVSHVGSSITVRGVASSIDPVYKYARDLRQSPRFSQVWVSAVTETTEGVTFEFTVTPAAK